MPSSCILQAKEPVLKPTPKFRFVTTRIAWVLGRAAENEWSEKGEHGLLLMITAEISPILSQSEHYTNSP